METVWNRMADVVCGRGRSMQNWRRLLCGLMAAVMICSYTFTAYAQVGDVSGGDGEYEQTNGVTSIGGGNNVFHEGGDTAGGSDSDNEVYDGFRDGPGSASGGDVTGGDSFGGDVTGGNSFGGDVSGGNPPAWGDPEQEELPEDGLLQIASQVLTQVTVKVTAAGLEGVQILGRTLTAYAYENGSRGESLGVLTDRQDGTYGILLEAGKTYWIEDASGAGMQITLEESAEEITAGLELQRESRNLEEIMVPEGSDGFAGEIRLYYVKNGEQILLDSTVESELDPENPADPVPQDGEILVDLSGIKVKDNVQDYVIYEYSLPSELTPVMGNASGVGSEWIYLNKRSTLGDVQAYGRILKPGDGRDSYVFQVYFIRTAGQFDIEFGFTYNAKIGEDRKDPQEVNARYLGKNLSFEVEQETEQKVTLEKSAAWVYAKHHDRWTSSSVGGDTPFNQIQYTIKVNNETGLPLSAELEECFGNSSSMMMRAPAQGGGSDTANNLFEIYVYGEEDTKTKITDLQMGYDAKDRRPVFTSAQCGVEIKWKERQQQSNGECFTQSGFDITLKEVDCKRLELVFYVEPYYGVKMTPRPYGSGTVNYPSNTVVKSVSGLEEPAYTQSVSAVASKTYTYSSASMSMYQSNRWGGDSVNAGGGPLGSAPGFTEKAGRIDFMYMNVDSGGDSWYAFEEAPYGSDWNNGDSDSSRNYFFHAGDFTTDGGWLGNSVWISFGGFSPSDEANNILSPTNAERVRVSDLQNEDIKSYKELTTIIGSNALSGPQAPPVYRCKVTSNGEQETVWVVVSPETFALAQGSQGRYGGRSAGSDYNWGPLTEGGTGENNIPGRIKIYLLGLTGNEKINFVYAKYQRILTTSPGNLVTDEFTRAGQKVGSTVTSYNRAGQAESSKYEEDSGDEKLLTKTGELLPDGSIKWTLQLDVTKLKKYYSKTDSASKGYYVADPQTSPKGEGYISKTAYLFEHLENGYRVSSGTCYDEKYNLVTKESPEKKYEAGVLYLLNTSGSIEAQYNFTQTSSYSGPDSVNILQRQGKMPSGFAMITDTSDLLQENCISKGNMGRDYVTLMYISAPSEGSLKRGVNEIYSASELTIPWGTNVSPGSASRLVDTAAAATVMIPSEGSKKMVPAEDGSLDTWTTTLEAELCQGGSQAFTGPYKIYDSMRGTKAITLPDEEPAGEAVARFIKLGSIRYVIATNSGSITGELDWSGSPEASGNAPSTMKGVERYGFNRYTFENDGLTFYLDYAPEKYLGLETSGTPNMQYGGYNYNMQGGFELQIDGLQNARKITLTYDTVFDYQAFAKEYPQLGKVSIEMNNEAGRNYENFGRDLFPAKAAASQLVFSVRPDLTKEYVEGSKDPYLYGADYRAEADVGAFGQKEVYLVDQLSSVEDIPEGQTEGTVYTKTDDPNAIDAWTRCLKISDLTIKAKNRLDQDGEGELVYQVKTDPQTGEDTVTVGENWSVAPVSDPAGEFAQVNPPDERAVSLDGNLFAYKISRKDNREMDPTLYFEITYRMSLNTERENFVGEPDPWRTPFRYLGRLQKQGYYSGGLVKLGNQMVICYDVKDWDARRQASGGIAAAALNPDQWVAAGTTVIEPFLKENEAWKEGTFLRADEEDPKQHITGTDTFRWDLVNDDYSAGIQEWLTHEWKDDTLAVTAWLDRNTAEEAYQGLGDNMLNAAWINLFYKHLTVKGWSVSLTGNDGVSQTVSVPFKGMDGDGNLIFQSDEKNEDGSALTVTVKPNRQVIGLKAGTSASGGPGVWEFKKQAETFTDPSREIYDAWGIGRYYEAYLTKEEVQEKKEQVLAQGGIPVDWDPYGHGLNRLFAADVSHKDYAGRLSIHYEAEIDWTGLFAEADSLRITDSFRSYYEENKNALDQAGNPIFDEEFRKGMDQALKEQDALDELNRSQGLTGEDAYQPGLLDLPKYSGVLNYVTLKEKIYGTKFDWEKGIEGQASLGKEAVVREDGTVDWKVTLTNPDLALKNLVVADAIAPDTSLGDAEKENTKLAISLQRLTKFSVVAVTGEEEKELCSLEQDPVTGTADIKPLSGVCTGGKVTFGGKTDSDGQENLFSVSFGRIEAGARLEIRYTTELDMGEFAAAGGNLEKKVLLSNTALANADNLSLTGSAEADLTPEPGAGVEKKAVEGGLLNENGWQVEAKVGTVDAAEFSLSDTVAAPEEIASFLYMKSMKVLMKDAQGAETVLYDSSADPAVDVLAEYGFAFEDGFRVGERGKTDFILSFQREKHKGESLAKGTVVTAEYVTALDETAYLEAAGENAQKQFFKLSNSVSYSRSGVSKQTAAAENSVGFMDLLGKTGTNVRKLSGTDTVLIDWNIDVYLTKLFTEAELAEADQAVVTDTLPDLKVLRWYKEDGVGQIKLVTLESGKEGSEIPADAYTVEEAGPQILITLENPSAYPAFRVVLTTQSPEGQTEGITNQARVEILGHEESVQSPKVIMEGNQHGYVLSNAHVGFAKLFKTDENGKSLAGAEFALYRLSCQETGSDHTHTEDCWEQESLLRLAKGHYQISADPAARLESALQTDASGVLALDALPYGTYMTVETRQPEGYILPEADWSGKVMSFVIGEDSTQEAPVRIDCSNTLTKVSVYKYWEEELNGSIFANQPVKEAKLAVWSAGAGDSRDRKIQDGVTDESGAVTFRGLSAGRYLLVEETAPSGFFTAQDIPFTLNDNGSITVDDDASAGVDADGSIFIKMQDRVALGELQITKKGEVIRDQNWIEKMTDYLVHAFDWMTGTLEGVTFDIYAGADISVNGVTVYEKDAKIGTVVTDREGKASLGGLPAGDYYTVETGTGDNYILDGSKRQFALTNVYEGNVLKEVRSMEVSNDRRQFSIRLNKKEQGTDFPLAGAVFGLYAADTFSIFAEDDLLDVGITGTDGVLTFQVSLPVGKDFAYYVKEISAPTGYQLSTETYPITFEMQGTDLAVKIQDSVQAMPDENAVQLEMTAYNTSQVIQIPVEKIWEDQGNRDGVRPESITVTLLADGKTASDMEGRPVEALTLNEKNGWKGIFSNLPKYRNGALLSYEAAETLPENSPYEGTVEKKQDGTIVFTNTHQIQLTRVAVAKLWNDADNRDGMRPESITVHLYADGTDTGKSLTLSEASGWAGAFEDLERYAAGEVGREVAYTVQEDPVEHYPDVEITLLENQDPVQTAYEITNTHELEKTSVSVTKYWDDNLDQDGVRPESITVHLYRDGELAETAALTARDGWKHTFADLPKYREGQVGQEIVYTVTEDPVEGYTSRTDRSKDGYELVNTHAIELTEVEVKKVWDDSNNQDGMRPESITVHLYADGTDTGKSLTLSEASGWAGAFEDLERYAAGEVGREVAYTVQEDPVEHYPDVEITLLENQDPVQTAYEITNTHELEKTSVSVTKYWDDNLDQDGVRPESITVHLYRDGELAETAALTARDGWKHTFADLPKYREGQVGQEIVYTVAEDPVEGYTSRTDRSKDGYELVNTHATELTGVEVKKVWDDSNNQDGMRPESVTVHLYADGTDTGKTLTLSESNSWAGRFADLERYAAGEVGREVVYTVAEDPVEGYVPEIIGDAGKGYSLVNRHAVEKTCVGVRKHWLDRDNLDGIRPEKIAVDLYADGEKTGLSLELSASCGWKGSFTDLDVYRDGKKIEYTVRENCPSGYAVSISGSAGAGYDISNTHYTETVRVEVTKRWEDNEDQDGIRPESVTVHLYADGRDTGRTLELSGQNGWHGVFRDLDRYLYGTEIVYTVEEVGVEGYARSVSGDMNSGFVLINTHQAAVTQTEQENGSSQDQVLYDEDGNVIDAHRMPKTGQLWWPVPALGAAGFVLVGAGLVRKRRKER